MVKIGAEKKSDIRGLMKVLLTILFSIFNVFAQEPVDPKDVSHLKQAGQMFVVQIVPGTKSSTVFVLGKEAAKIKIDNLKVEATLFEGKIGKKISLQKKDDHFVTSSSLKGDAINLKIQDENPGQTEEIKIKLKH